MVDEGRLDLARGSSLDAYLAIIGQNLGGAVEPMAFERSMNGATFEVYIRDRIAPRVQPGDVIVVDWLGAHRAPGARAAAKEHGAKFCMLSPDVPDLSPVESCGSKVTELVRGAAPRSAPQVYQAIGRGTDRDVKG
ncbi:transposase [Sorangium sp. So ce542]|uniref:transposase n=1 Tax=Sorangium sp. So ce542 TaxID=3133316 RepID=UPI003F61ED8A